MIRLAAEEQRKAIEEYLEEHDFEHFEPKAVLFDMDGVLYDSMPLHCVAWRKSMAHYGITMTDLDAYATEGARGVDTIRMMVRKQQGRDIDEQEAQAMYDLKSRLFHEMDEAPLMPGIMELMERIHQSGLVIGVVTGSGQKPLIARLLRDFGQWLREDRIVTAYDVTRGKPAPDPYLMGLQKVGAAVVPPVGVSLMPSEAIVVENAPLGVQAAVAARIFTIAVNTGPLPDEQLCQAGANLIFSRMTDLRDAWEPFIQGLRRTNPFG